MPRKKSQRGSGLVAVLAFLVISAILLNVLAVRSGRVSGESRRGIDREAAGFEARGGIRWMAALWASGAKPGSLSRVDPEGALTVTVQEDWIRATYAWRNGVSSTVTARFSRGTALGLSDWREGE